MRCLIYLLTAAQNVALQNSKSHEKELNDTYKQPHKYARRTYFFKGGRVTVVCHTQDNPSDKAAFSG